jgi:hypothetical protein
MCRGKNEGGGLDGVFTSTRELFGMRISNLTERQIDGEFSQLLAARLLAPKTDLPLITITNSFWNLQEASLNPGLVPS